MKRNLIFFLKFFLLLIQSIVLPEGIEPPSQVPETCVLSIELREDSL